MNSAQHIFYILGSVWFGIFILLVLFLIVAGVAIQISVHRLINKLHNLADDAQIIAKDVSRISSAVAEKVDSNLLSIASKILTGFMGLRKAHRKRKQAEEDLE